MNLGEVEGEIHVSASLSWDVLINAKSSRRGKEDMKSKIFEGGIADRIRKSDLRAEENPCNWTREISRLPCSKTRIKFSTRPKEQIQPMLSGFTSSTAESRLKKEMVRVW